MNLRKAITTPEDIKLITIDIETNEDVVLCPEELSQDEIEFIIEEMQSHLKKFYPVTTVLHGQLIKGNPLTIENNIPDNISGSISYSTTEPANAEVDDEWYDLTDPNHPIRKRYNGTTWEIV